MKTSQMLDILGNKNRREILRLLASRPCYVTEISERIQVSPTAVIDHLEMLETSGIIRNYIDKQRRKYFHIAYDFRLEVLITPDQYNEKSNPISSENIERDEGWLRSIDESVEKLRTVAERLEEVEGTISKLSKELNSTYFYHSDLISRCKDIIEEVAESPLEAQILFSLVKGQGDPNVLFNMMEVDRLHLERAIIALEEKGIIRFERQNTKIVFKINTKFPQ